MTSLAPTFTLRQLVDIIERSPKRAVKFQQISRQPGRERFRGLCPFHSEKTPSFDVFVGRDGKSRFYCQSCQERGDAIHWLTKVEGKSWREAAGGYKPDPDAARRRNREIALQRLRYFEVEAWRDRNPDSIIPDFFLDVGGERK